MYLAENIKSLRKAKNLTQEDVAEALGISPQSVSKWERGETLPDITLLPPIAALFETSVDQLIGMERIYSAQAKSAVFTASYAQMRQGEVSAAAATLTEALKTYPNDTGMLSNLAMVLALNTPADLDKAVSLCERALEGTNEKVAHTTRAALCMIYLKAGKKDKALEVASRLPHARESREVLMEQIGRAPCETLIDAYIRYILMGETDDPAIVSVTIA